MSKPLPRVNRAALVLVVLAVLAGAAGYVSATDRTEVTADFTSTTGLHVGDDVRVLGVKVGEVTAIDPLPGKVEVQMALEPDVRIPADAKAAIVAPSLVSGRFVQLSPAYTEGPVMAEGARLGVDRTAVPVSFDEVKEELTQLAGALGPRGRANGSLSEAITVMEANLAQGNDAQLRKTVESLRTAADSLATGREDLFDTVSNLNSFTQNLVRYDAAVAGFSQELSDVSRVLADNRVLLGQAVKGLRTTLPQVARFAGDNRASLSTGVRQLTTLTRTIGAQADDVASVLHTAPTAIANLSNTMNDRAVLGRLTLTNLDNAAELLCGGLLGVGGTSEDCRKALQPLLGLVGLSSVDGVTGGRR